MIRPGFWLAAALAGACLGSAAPTRLAAAPASLLEDTVLAVRRGQVLIGEGVSGRISVEAWDRDRVELVEEGGERRYAVRVVGERLTLVARGPERTAGRTAVRAERRRGGGAVTLRVPAWMPVQLRGGTLTAAVDGLTAVVDLNTVEGELSLVNVAGDVFARSVEGSVSVERARGRLRLRSVNESVRAARVDAESVLVESTSGDITLDEVAAQTLDATTTEGNVSFSGPLRAGASYRLATHDGDLLVALPADASAAVTVSTFDGEFRPEFPITVDRFRGGKEMSFTLGRGSARLTLAAFDGDIVLARR